MRDHNLTPPSRKLSPLVKVKLATLALSGVLAERMTEEDAGRLLREVTGTQWSLLTCLQYLSGKEALAAIDNLPADWVEDGMTKEALEQATRVAAFTVANAHPNGVPLCASELAKQYRGNETIDDATKEPTL